MSITLPGTGREVETADQIGTGKRQSTHVESLGSNETHIGGVHGAATVVSASFTRPSNTTAYSTGDIVANNGTAAPMSFSVARVNDGAVRIKRARLKKTNTTLTNAQFRLHLYRSSPTIANDDNAAFSTTESGYLGAFSFDLTTSGSGVAFSDAGGGTAAPLVGSDILALPTSGAKTVFGLLEARAGYTPTSGEVFTVSLEVEQVA